MGGGVRGEESYGRLVSLVCRFSIFLWDEIRGIARMQNRHINMKHLLDSIYSAIIIVVSVGLTACYGSPADKLAEAYSLSKERPDSAYLLLRDIDYSDLADDSLKAKYILTKAMTNLRIGRSLITDTLLTDAADYYISVGDTANWALASQMISGYDFITGNTASSLQRLVNMLPRIKNPGLLWDTHKHILEIAINGGDYAEAYDHADWLLTHTNVPEQKLKFSSAKGAALYMQGERTKALAIYDSIIATGAARDLAPAISSEFYGDYAEILDGAGYPHKAIAVLDSIYQNGVPLNDVDRVGRLVSLAQFNINAKNLGRAKTLLDSINIDGVRSVFEIYVTAAMLKGVVEYETTGRFPSELMHRITKTIHRDYQLSRFDRQTAMESVIELSEDKSALRIQKQRLWLLILAITLVAVIGGVGTYIIMNRRKQRLIEAQERIETLDRMVKAAEHTERTDKEAVLKRMVLQQMGILKTFASTPTAQSEEALRRISNVGVANECAGTQLVDWDNLYILVDELFDGFHEKLLRRFPEVFTNKEIQLISLLKAGFSTKEISFLTGQSVASVYVRKSAIRKKLATAENRDFMAQIEARL